jgi:hypothetical protein
VLFTANENKDWFCPDHYEKGRQTGELLKVSELCLVMHEIYKVSNSMSSKVISDPNTTFIIASKALFLCFTFIYIWVMQKVTFGTQ